MRREIGEALKTTIDIGMYGTAAVLALYSAVQQIGSFLDYTKIVQNSKTSSTNLGGGEQLLQGNRRNELLNLAENPRLKSAISELYRPNAIIGDGGTADSVRYELLTGNLVGGKSHIQNAEDSITFLVRIIANEDLMDSEVFLAIDLILDLINALGGKK